MRYGCIIGVLKKGRKGQYRVTSPETDLRVLRPALVEKAKRMVEEHPVTHVHFGLIADDHQSYKLLEVWDDLVGLSG